MSKRKLSDIQCKSIFPKQSASKCNKIVQISCGSEHSMAVTSGGDLYSWGWGEHGNLGHGTTTNQMVPTRVTKFGAESL